MGREGGGESNANNSKGSEEWPVRALQVTASEAQASVSFFQAPIVRSGLP